MRSVLWAVVLVLGCCTLQPALLHGHLPSPQAPKLIPDLSEEIQDYEVVVPVRIGADGPRESDEPHFLRRRRSAEDSNLFGEEDDVSHVTYLVTANRRPLYLELVPDVRFLSERLIVEHLGLHEDDPESLIQDDSPLGRHCYYSGHVRGQADSLVALSICHSLFGSIHTGEDHFLIEPYRVNSSGSEQAEQAGEDEGVSLRPHRLYRLPNQSHTCGVKDAGPSAGLASTLAGLKQHVQAATGGSSFSDHSSHRRQRRSADAPHHRQRRSVSQERNVEMLVVADSRMLGFHGSNVHHYILTLMSIVASIYRHHTIGNAINIVVIKVQVLRHRHEEPIIKANAALTLQSFCDWQHRRNPSTDEHPEHYDNAILLTREDLCRAADRCDTLGLAEIGSICDIRRSCSIVEDNGLSAAFTIAHEVGHVFNLQHDDSQKCKDINIKPEVKKVMASTLDTNAEPWSWSNCSRVMITEFLDGGYGECLLDKPSALNLDHYMSDQIKKTFPGEQYNLDQQCQLVFGNTSKQCPPKYFQKAMMPCATLWCQDHPGASSGCRTQHMPWADGTYCAYNHWCEKGKCVPRQKYQSVDGGWGSWTAWGKCSRSCGGGVKRSIRFCDRPRPRSGGRYCLGKKKKVPTATLR